MQMSEANELRKMWGARSCSHANLEKEYHLGTDTGDYVCTQCGRSGPGRDWPEDEARQVETKQSIKPDAVKTNF